MEVSPILCLQNLFHYLNWKYFWPNVLFGEQVILNCFLQCSQETQIDNVSPQIVRSFRVSFDFANRDLNDRMGVHRKRNFRLLTLGQKEKNVYKIMYYASL
jgi:hypothetical protein